jgi:hypothetical protein
VKRVSPPLTELMNQSMVCLTVRSWFTLVALLSKSVTLTVTAVMSMTAVMSAMEVPDALTHNSVSANATA